MTKKLYRSRTQAKLGGVCAGLGAYLGLDPTLVRVLVVTGVVLTFPVGLVAYVALWAVMPVGEQPPVPDPGLTPPPGTTSG